MELRSTLSIAQNLKGITKIIKKMFFSLSEKLSFFLTKFYRKISYVFVRCGIQFFLTVKISEANVVLVEFFSLHFKKNPGIFLQVETSLIIVLQNILMLFILVSLSTLLLFLFVVLACNKNQRDIFQPKPIRIEFGYFDTNNCAFSHPFIDIPFHGS